MIKPIDEVTKDEWREIAKMFHPEWDDLDFEILWVAFAEMKRRKRLH